MNQYDQNHVYKPTYFLLGVKTVVTNVENKILLLKRSSRVSNPHQWDFGGGGVEKEENPMDAAIRETKEETNLDLHNLKPLTTYLDTSGKDQSVIIAFTANTASTDVKLSWEHEEFQWVTTEELKDIQLLGVHAFIRDSLLANKYNE